VESTEKIVSSKLQLVDLAGSERTKKTGTSGLQLNEAQHINKSLSFLEQVVLALSEKNREYVPYRQTVLTNFLRDSLGGNCMTVMVANM
jgi:kinesin family protein 6/9